eukprot:SAG31_NODE_1266_length_9065_cov_44.433939_8_plen_45_part_00
MNREMDLMGNILVLDYIVQLYLARSDEFFKKSITEADAARTGYF